MPDRGVEAAALRRELRSRLGELTGPLQILAENLLGEEDCRIDWVAVEPSGRLWIVLLDADGSDETLLLRGLVQRAWVQARLGDWLQLAPSLPARTDTRPRLLLLAPGFSRGVRIAAREADEHGIRLARFGWSRSPGGERLAIEALAAPAHPPGLAKATEPTGSPERAGSGAAPVGSSFQSGLSERDFGGNGAGRKSP